MHYLQIKPQNVILQNATHRAEIYLYGGLLNRFEIKYQPDTWFNAIAAYTHPDDAQANITNGFHSAKLSPYACRLQNAKYEFSGHTYHCSKHILNNHAIHGLIYDAHYTIEQYDFSEQYAWCVICTHYTNYDKGFPFHYELKVKYLLQNDSLSITTQVTNTDTQAFPLVDGWHPYFTLGGKVDDWYLQINSYQQLEFNQDLLPTGKILSNDTFQTARKLSHIDLDNCFILNNHTQPACTLYNNTLQLKIFAEASYPYLQIYIPDNRDCIAIENLSGAPNSFNNGMGLIILESGMTQTFTTQYTLQSCLS